MLGLIGGILAFILRLLGAQKPQAVKEGEDLGAAKSALETEKQGDVQVQKASAARDAVAAADGKPAGLQHAIETDPDCRDCTT